ncbi:MAG: hypothetical protein ACRDOP_18470 [Gaiellaceae bacterium]
MRFLRKHPRLRPLDERECYLRLHGRRNGDVEVLRAPEPRSTPFAIEQPPAPVEEPRAAPGGPTDDAPALHLVIAYPRSGSRLTGEQVRRELLRRMQARTGEAA